MYTREALLDLHDRCHRSLAGVVDHCRGLTPDQLDRSIEGFGYATIREQLQHAIGAERYWISVVRDAMDASEDPADAASIDTLASFRAATRAYLRDASKAELNEPRAMRTFHGTRPALVPAHVVLRTQTHLYHHIGQVAAMCRLLDHPLPQGLDFPLTPAES